MKATRLLVLGFVLAMIHRPEIVFAEGVCPKGEFSSYSIKYISYEMAPFVLGDGKTYFDEHMCADQESSRYVLRFTEQNNNTGFIYEVDTAQSTDERLVGYLVGSMTNTKDNKTIVFEVDERFRFTLESSGDGKYNFKASFPSIGDFPGSDNYTDELVEDQSDNW